MLNEKRTATEEQVRFYRENGFVQIDNVLSDEEVEELREYLSEVLSSESDRSAQTDREGGVYYRVLNQRVNTWRDHGGMARFVLGERFADLGKQLTGFEGIRLFHDHALLKMPKDSKPTPWHQDWPYWPMRETGAFSIWIALDDVDEHNGCMMFVPKTQNIKNLKGVDLVSPEDLFAQENAEHVDRNTAVLVRMKAGSCTFHDGLISIMLMRIGAINRAGRSRSSSCRTERPITAPAIFARTCFICGSATCSRADCFQSWHNGPDVISRGIDSNGRFCDNQGVSPNAMLY